MVVRVAHHPLILGCELEIRLLEAVAMFPLEPTLTPNHSRRENRIVQSSLDEDPVNRSEADGRDPLHLIVPQVPLNLVRPQCLPRLSSKMRSMVP
jgi:hypothetical protein